MITIELINAPLAKLPIVRFTSLISLIRADGRVINIIVPALVKIE